MKKFFLFLMAVLLGVGYIAWGIIPADELLSKISLTLLFILCGLLIVYAVFSGDTLTATSLLAVIGAYDFCKAIRPPLPASLVALYVGFAFISAVIFISIENSRMSAWRESFFRFLTDERFGGLRLGAGLLFTSWLGVTTYAWAKPALEPPVGLRVIHPAPPASVDLHGHKYKLAEMENPFRKDKGNFEKWVQEGKTVYYQNCFYCHGDTLNGKGHFAPALNPLPANFVDVGTIAMLQESFVFWRVAKGGPGLPKESTPWSSAMPKWDDMLTEEEIWKVVLYIYEGTGHQPRTWEEH